MELSFTGQSEIEAMLSNWQDPTLTKRAQAATKKGAQVLQAPLRAAVTPLSRRMGQSVYVHAATREKPAYVIGHHKRTAFFWPWLIGGTKDHGPRSKPVLVFVPGFNPFSGVSSKLSGTTQSLVHARTVRGVKPHPVVAAVAAQYGGLAEEAVIAALKQESVA